jgi:SAM-dependent methyltransferase
MPWYFAVAERDHEIHDPTSAAKIRLLGERLRLGPDSHVLDIASGTGGPALILAEAFGCRVTGVEQSEEFFEAACAASRARGLDRIVEFVHADASDFTLERRAYDVSMCLGASFIWGDLPRTLDALKPAAKNGGHVVVGEPYWRRWPLPPGVAAEGYVPLAETAALFGRAGLHVVGLIASSDDDWDRYESLHWRAVDEWLAEHPDDPDAPEFRERNARYRDRYLREQRELLGWAIFIARKR